MPLSYMGDNEEVQKIHMSQANGGEAMSGVLTAEIPAFDDTCIALTDRSTGHVDSLTGFEALDGNFCTRPCHSCCACFCEEVDSREVRQPPV